MSCRNSEAVIGHRLNCVTAYLRKGTEVVGLRMILARELPASGGTRPEGAARPARSVSVGNKSTSSARRGVRAPWAFGNRGSAIISGTRAFV